MGSKAENLDLTADSIISPILEKLGGVSRIEKVLDMLDKALAELGHVNLIIAGKSGVGKSTLINSVFRQDVADTGVGKPVTDKMKLYEREGVPLRIYDTKGLELDADAQAQTIQEINALIKSKRALGEEQHYIHGIWYCVNAGASRVEDFELNFIRKISSEVPVIVVITRASRARTILNVAGEYKQKKIDAEAMKKVVDDELSSLPQYRGCHIVLAKKEDGERAFGLEELTKATAQMIPNRAKKAFTNAQKVLVEQKVQASNLIINSYAVTAATIGAVPIPFSDAPLLISAELAMCARITATFGIDLDKATAANLVVALAGVTGVTITGKLVVSNLLKLVPGAGSVAGGVISGTTAAILMQALGRTYVAVLRMLAEGEKQEDDLQKKAFQNEMKAMMKKELKIILADLKKSVKKELQNDTPQAGSSDGTAEKTLQDLANLS